MHRAAVASKTRHHLHDETRVRARVRAFVRAGPALPATNKSDRRENLMNCLIYEKPSARR